MTSQFETPLKRVKGLGKAGGAAHHWWMQRLTAVALLPLSLWLILALKAEAGASYGQWLGWVSDPLHACLLLAFLGVSISHLYLGLVVIIQDYVSHRTTRCLSLMAVQLGSATLLLTGVVALLNLLFINRSFLLSL